MELEFAGELWSANGPGSWYFVTVPDEESHVLKAESTAVRNGWGMIPVTVRIGGSEWDTSLFPQDGRFVMPVKAAVRRAERLEEGDTPTVRVKIRA
jgi:hypothetical protein